MQHYRTILAVIICLATCSIYSCNKTPTQPAETATHSYTDSTLIKAYYFKPGTYWIYTDSVTGQTDSYSVTYAVNKVYRDYIYSQHNTYVDSTSYYVSYLRSENIDHTSLEQRACKWVLDKYGANYYYYTHDSSEGPFYLSPHLRVYSNIDSFNYTCYDSTYTNLKLVGDGNGNRYLVGKNIGMVKMILPDQHHTWELVRHHIVQ